MKSQTRLSVRLINQSNRSISVRLSFLFCSRVFISRSYENRSNGDDCNGGDGDVGNHSDINGVIVTFAIIIIIIVIINIMQVTWMVQFFFAKSRFNWKYRNPFVHHTCRYKRTTKTFPSGQNLFWPVDYHVKLVWNETRPTGDESSQTISNCAYSTTQRLTLQKGAWTFLTVPNVLIASPEPALSLSSGTCNGRLVWSLVLTKRTAVSGNEIDNVQDLYYPRCQRLFMRVAVKSL